MNLKHEHGRISLSKEDQVYAELTYTEVDPDTWSVNRTFVDPSLRGQGIAGKLMDALVERAEAEDKKLTATCAYAVTWLEKHPEVPQA